MSNVWDRAVGFGVCKTLTDLGSGLVNAGAWTAMTGAGAKFGLTAIGLGSLSNLAAGALCSEIDLPITPPPNDGQGCWKISEGGYAWIEVRRGTNQEWERFSSASPYDDATEILQVEVLGPGVDGTWQSQCTFSRLGGGASLASITGLATINDASRVAWRLDPREGSCSAGDGTPEPLPPGYDTPAQYTDNSTNCTYNVSLQGFIREYEGALAKPVYIVEGANNTRNTYGRIGGCNFEPTLVIGGGGDGGNQPPAPPTPVPPTLPGPGPDGEPWWAPLAKAALQGVVAGATEELLEQLFTEKLPVGNRTIYAACEYNENGEKEEFTVNFPEETYNSRVLTALDAIVDFQQQILYWKTPTCSATPTPVIGDPVTVNWISDEPSPVSGDRFVKRFVYFDQSDSSLLDHVEHWHDFVWTSGPVIVFAKGTALGKPEVWASSEAEGKRVISHAAAIAGVDMSTVEWVTTSPRSSRYGLTGTMRVMRDAKGVLGVTKRDGPSGFPDAYR